jgi:hypothetical protein
LLRKPGPNLSISLAVELWGALLLLLLAFHIKQMNHDDTTTHKRNERAG